MKHKVLVVDDETSITDLIRRILVKNGYNVSTAQNGSDGLKQFEVENPDLVVTDIIMPDMEGLEFISTLKKRNRNVPIIVMSGNIIGVNFLKAARMLGANAAIKKPFHPEELVQTVSQFLK